MTPDAAERMHVYQQGQRAFRNNIPCPHTDWRAKTWQKGFDAAREYWENLDKECESENLARLDREAGEE